jgi:Asp-tRNA(Asn)/Glu-tRNA(Gln) amidotransferase A subunit family amidase
MTPPVDGDRLPGRRPASDRRRTSLTSRLDSELAPSRDTGPITSSLRISSSITVQEALSRAEHARTGGAYDVIFGEEARATAQRRSTHEDRRPLAGVPFAIKNLFAVAGQPLRAGSASRGDVEPEPRDAHVVALLRGTGAVPVGLTALHEFAFGVTGINHHAGTPRHPSDEHRITGGSSSGSALAVAEGSAQFALGTDTGGSVRIPAALCGVVGFKPAKGTYPMGGVYPLAPTLDHVGILAPDMRTTSVVHELLTGEPSRRPLPPSRVGVITAELDSSTDEVGRCVRGVLDKLERAGTVLVPVRWPSGEEVFATSTAIMFAEAAHQHRRILENDPGRVGDDVAERLRHGLSISADSYLSARRRRSDLRRRVTRILDEVDCVLGPTVPITAPQRERANESDISASLVSHTRLANVVGLPAVSVPVRRPSMPVGVQVTSRSNERALGIAAHVEATLHF